MPKTEAQKIMGVNKRPEDKFKRGQLISFLTTIKDGFIDPRNYTTTFYSAKRGIPDVIFYHHGQAYAFECKSKSGILSSTQKMRRVEMERAGVIYFVPTPLNFEAIKQTMLERTK